MFVLKIGLHLISHHLVALNCHSKKHSPLTVSFFEFGRINIDLVGMKKTIYRFVCQNFMFPEDCNCSQLLNVQIMSKNMALGKFHEISLTLEE
jgi:hypothetical protein